MLMPDKHIRLAESLLGLGAYLLDVLAEPQTVDQLWQRFKSDRQAGRYPVNQSFENMVLALDALYAVGAISDGGRESDGVLQRCG